jgi:hypothetical protein
MISGDKCKGTLYENASNQGFDVPFGANSDVRNILDELVDDEIGPNFPGSLVIGK